MPIYEYACSACGHQLEIMQSLSDTPLRQCPECRKRTLKKMVSAAGFVLKGTGWYVTDFRDKAKPAADKKETAEADSAASDKKKDDVKKDGGDKDSSKKAAEKTDKKKKAASTEP